MNRRTLPLAILLVVLPAERFLAAAEPPPKISLNTLGYLPAGPKRASIIAAAKRFKIERTPDGVIVLESALEPAKPNHDTNEQIAVAYFTKLTAPGDYRLVVEGAEPAPFRIAADLYRQPFQLVTRAMYLWRCGTAVSADHGGDHFHHAACHQDDAWLDYVGGGHERRPSVGGWHDAGDYNKYVVNDGATVGVMFRAWEDFGPQIERVPLNVPESGGKLPDFLAELKWELDWLLTMQADDGSVYHKLSAVNFCGFILPERDAAPRFFVPWSSAATADFVAMTAMAAKHFHQYDAAYADKCLAAARKSHEFLQSHPEDHHPAQREFKTGGYDSSDVDDRLWAAAEFWDATGDAAALQSLELTLGQLKETRRAGADVDWDWSNVKNLGLFTYLFSTRPGRNPQLVDDIKQSVLSAADQIVATANEHGYARPLGRRYYWGCNGSVARQTLFLHAAYRLANDERYRHTSLDALDHLFGRNYYSRSYVTGLGHQPPLHPHDRRSIADNVANPWPGYLVGGPQPTALGWHDDQEDYRSNEIAINWNAALIYALAWQLP
jgi:endoglucanase